MQEIQFFCDDIDFSIKNEKKVSEWLGKISHAEGRTIEDLNIIFTSDENLLKINKDFLQHDYYTDVITFQNDTENLSGEIYLSIDRIKENSAELDVAFIDELHRVMAHGLLHLIGYRDKSAEEQETMRSREDFCLTLRHF